VAKLYTTISDIPNEELTTAMDRAKKVISQLAIDNGFARLYSMRKPSGCKPSSQCNRTLLYMYLYAIELWDNTPNAQNYITVDQMKMILSAVEQYFGICQ